MSEPAPLTRSSHPVWEVFGVFLRLGLTSFGGPVAHLAFFRSEFVSRRGWLSERAYADLVALCQFLPGPASSQVGMAIGLLRAGFAGAAAAWLGFTLPSAVALTLLGMGVSQQAQALPAGLLQGLAWVAVAVVAQAVWGMAAVFCKDGWRRLLALAAAGVLLLNPAARVQLAVLVVAGCVGLWLPDRAVTHPSGEVKYPVKPLTGMALLLLFLVILLGLPWVVRGWPQAGWQVFDVFYRVGALVFGGGHVVLPLLQAEVLPRGWVSLQAFMAGYGAAQAAPGPLFSFAAFLGAASSQAWGGIVGAALALVAIFLPGFLLVAGALPLWGRLSHNRRARSFLSGVNAAVVGLLLAALIQSVLSVHTVASWADPLGVLAAWLALTRWRWPPWAAALGCGLAGWTLGTLAGA